MPLIDMDAERHSVDPKTIGPEFVLGGEHFTCLPAQPGVAIQRIAVAMRRDERGRQVFDAPNVIGFIEDVLIDRRWIEVKPGESQDDLSEEERKSVADDGGYWEDADDKARFTKVIESTDDIIELDTLGNLMTQLSEQYGERPTRRSSRSRRG